MTETVEYIVRKEGTAGRYGLGEVVSPGVTLFRDGFYNLTGDALARKIAILKPQTK
jgi:hypothetical protein